MAKTTIKIVINFLGAPNSGKTVAATSIFSKLKQRHLDAVLITEFAHQMIVEERKVAMSDQLYVWANQNHRIFAGYQHADLVITDSPILLGAIYNKRESPAFKQVVLEEHQKYNNLNIIMSLDDSYPYSMVGRIHDLSDAQRIQKDIQGLLTTYNLPFLFYHNYDEDDLVDLIISYLE